jgi:hypothetical protein
MALRKITKTAGHWLAGLIFKVDQEIQFDTTANPEMDTTGGAFIWKTITSNIASWKLRDNTKGQDIIAVDTSADEIDIPSPYVFKVGGNAISGVNTGDEVSATESVEGIAEIATQAEVNTGTDATRIVTPDTLEDKTYGTFTGSTLTDNAVIKTLLQELETAVEAVSNMTATAQSTNYNAVDRDFILMTTGASDKTVTLPAVASSTDAVIEIKKVDSGAGNVIIDGNLSETIDGATTQTISAQYTSITVHCDGTEWWIK